MPKVFKGYESKMLFVSSLPPVILPNLLSFVRKKNASHPALPSTPTHSNTRIQTGTPPLAPSSSLITPENKQCLRELHKYISLFMSKFHQLRIINDSSEKKHSFVFLFHNSKILRMNNKLVLALIFI